MIYKNFKDKKLSLLGFGCMRLPLKDGNIDTVELAKMVDYAMENGVNYFDTAFPYHNGYSEIEIGKALKKYPRDSFFLATKFPGHQIATSFNPKEVFEKQLKKCQVDYFDFYLLHNVYENSIKVYDDPQWGIIDYFVEQKKLGRIKHLGFSSHGKYETLKNFLDKYGEHMEFCQLQVNYLDWTLQEAEAKYMLLQERNIPLWVMEPVRGGKLAKYNEKITAKLREYRPDESTAAWCFRFLQSKENIHMILSGMSNYEQMVDNINTFKEYKPLKEDEEKYLFEIAESLKSSIPCTACGYCLKGCPLGLEIPSFIKTYNELRVEHNNNATLWIEALDDGLKPNACLKCGQCSEICPQKIKVPEVLEDLNKIIASMPTWVEISKQREEASKKID